MIAINAVHGPSRAADDLEGVDFLEEVGVLFGKLFDLPPQCFDFGQ